MLVCAFTLVSRVLGQSHINLGLKLIAQVAVLRTGGQKHYCRHILIFISKLYAKTSQSLLIQNYYIIPSSFLLDLFNLYYEQCEQCN